MASKLSTARAPFERANLEAARIVPAAPERYPAGSLMAIWADLVLEASDEAGQVCVALDRPAGYGRMRVTECGGVLPKRTKAVHRWQSRDYMKTVTPKTLRAA